MTDSSGRVLVTPGNPRGVCLIHMFTEYRCGPECVVARVALRRIDDDLRVHWRRVFGTKRAA